MTDNSMVTSGVTGSLSAKIQGHPDFETNWFTAYCAEGILQISAVIPDGLNHRSFLFVYNVPKNEPPTFDRLFYNVDFQDGSESARLTTVTRVVKSMEIEFDLEKGTYKSSFNFNARTVLGGGMDILGRFDLKTIA